MGRAFTSKRLKNEDEQPKLWLVQAKIRPFAVDAKIIDRRVIALLLLAGQEFRSAIQMGSATYKRAGKCPCSLALLLIFEP